MPPGNARTISKEAGSLLKGAGIAWAGSKPVSRRLVTRFRAKREHFLPGSQGHNLALTVLYVPYSLNLEGPGAARAVGQHVCDVVIVHQVFSIEPPVGGKKKQS